MYYPPAFIPWAITPPNQVNPDFRDSPPFAIYSVTLASFSRGYATIFLQWYSMVSLNWGMASAFSNGISWMIFERLWVNALVNSQLGMNIPHKPASVCGNISVTPDSVLRVTIGVSGKTFWQNAPKLKKYILASGKYANLSIPEAVFVRVF
jgi:hypothetical protein